ncbi:MAG: long-chain fatty acid--CoA ligase [Deltaproteobacteria bacterium]|nr:long-chain fatty acid--CoA ligase [Deltaproteobacteria bacterium]MCK5679212.1 long-chain fatty acid--CoA ligase [bacterium]
MLNLASVLDYSASEYPDKTAIIFGEQQFTFSQLNTFCCKIANGLVAAGVGKGDKVVVSCLNLPYFPMVYYAILKAGAVVVPISVLSKSREIAYHLKDSDAKAFFCFQGTPELPMGEYGFKGFQETESCELFWLITADPAAPSPISGTQTLGMMMAPQAGEFETVATNSDDTSVILYTSGTTGFPKGAELSHSNMVMNAIASRDLQSLKHDDSHAICLPLFHSLGQTVQMNAGLMKGCTIILIPKFTPEAVFDAIQNHGATIFVGVPTMYWAILNFEDKEGLFDFEQIRKTLRLGASGGAALPLEIIKNLEEKYQMQILEGYGLSETCPVATFNQTHKPCKPGSIGFPIWGVEVKIFDDQDQEVAVGEVGEVVISGHNVMKGYYNKPEETAAAFNGGKWFHTGDLGTMDEDGFFYIVDRVKDMVIRGGFNVYPRELEEVLLTHPAISLAAVIGVPHDRHGEEVKAVVVLKEGQQATPEEIIAWSKEQMAAYKYPRIVDIRDSLPMSATGKILKKELKAEVK